MCDGSPSSAAEALAQLRGALDYLNASDAASLPGEVQAQVLRELEHSEARHTAARARYLAAFTAQSHYEADGQGTTRAWLKWQTHVTSGAAAGAVGWSRRLAAHPVIDRALAAGELSSSWAKQLCAWTDRLPEAAREDADQILCEAAADCGMSLRDLGGLAEEMFQRTRPPVPSGDTEDRFEERFLQLGKTLGGAGRVEADLTPGCTHALSTVLEALGKKAGPEDSRTAAQRRHDALEEACRRLITAGMVPGRAGQPTQLSVHMTLHQLLGLPGADAAVREWVAAQAAIRDGWLTGPAADAAACDATVTPVVTGYVDPAALDQLTDLLHGGHSSTSPVATGPVASGLVPAADSPAGRADSRPVPAADSPTGRVGGRPVPVADSPTGPAATSLTATGEPGSDGACGAAATGAQAGRPAARAPATRARLRRAMLGLAIQALSGPGGLASHLRTTATTATTAPAKDAARTAAPRAPKPEAAAAGTAAAGTAADRAADAAKAAAHTRAGLSAAVSLPLDIAAATPNIPSHLRKAAAIRHSQCAFPGCDQPFSVCDLHHLIPRSHGGATSLPNLVPLCQFHHLTAIHRWGWTLRLHPDGTTTATSPDGSRAFHSHSPPGRAA